MSTKLSLHLNNPKDNRIWDAVFQQREISPGADSFILREDGKFPGGCIFFPNLREANYEPAGVRIYPGESGALTFLHKEVCVETWIKLIDYPASGNNYTIYCTGFSWWSNNTFKLSITSGKKLQLDYYRGRDVASGAWTNQTLTSTTEIPLNRWVHVGALVCKKAGDTSKWQFSLLIDGVKENLREEVRLGGETILWQGGSVAVGDLVWERGWRYRIAGTSGDGQGGYAQRMYSPFNYQAWHIVGLDDNRINYRDDLRTGIGTHFNGFRGYMQGFHITTAGKHSGIFPYSNNSESYTVPTSLTYSPGIDSDKISGYVARQAISFSRPGNLGSGRKRNNVVKRGCIQIPPNVSMPKLVGTDFTIEGWFRLTPCLNRGDSGTSAGLGNRFTILQHYANNNTSEVPWRIYIRNSENSLTFFVNDGANNLNIFSLNNPVNTPVNNYFAPPFNEWFFLALSSGVLNNGTRSVALHINGSLWHVRNGASDGNFSEQFNSASGSGATFNITRNASGEVSDVSIAATGSNYKTGEVLVIAGANIGGVTPADNLELVVTSVSFGGNIQTVLPDEASIIPGAANQVYTGRSTTNKGERTSRMQLCGDNGEDRDYVEVYDYRISTGPLRYGNNTGISVQWTPSYTPPSRLTLDEHTRILVSGATNSQGQFVWEGRGGRSGVLQDANQNTLFIPAKAVQAKNYQIQSLSAIEISSAGNTEVLGTYFTSDIKNGKLSYLKEDGTASIEWSGTLWFIKTGPPNYFIRYYSNSDVASPHLAQNWQLAGTPGTVGPLPNVFFIGTTADIINLEQSATALNLSFTSFDVNGNPVDTSSQTHETKYLPLSGAIICKTGNNFSRFGSGALLFHEENPGLVIPGGRRLPGPSTTAITFPGTGEGIALGGRDNKWRINRSAISSGSLINYINDPLETIQTQAETWTAVATDQQRFIAVGLNKSIVWVVDTASPSSSFSRNLPSPPWNLIGIAYAFSLGAYMALDNEANKVLVSTDNGDTWTIRNIPDAEWTCISGNFDRFVIVARGTASTAKIMTSTDLGVTWIERSIPSLSSYNFVDIAWASLTFVVVVNQSDQVLISRDLGDTWERKFLPTAGYWTKVGCNNSHFIITTPNGGAVMSANWGDTWSTLPVQPSIQGVAKILYGINDTWFLVGNDRIVMSTDTFNSWTTRNLTSVSRAGAAITVGGFLVLLADSTTIPIQYISSAGYPYDSYVVNSTDNQYIGGGNPQSGQTRGAITNYWIAAKNDTSQLTTGNNNWIASQVINLPTSAIYYITIRAAGDDTISFYIDGDIAYESDDPKKPIIVGGSQIGSTGGFTSLTTFNAVLQLSANQHTLHAVVRDSGGQTGLLVHEVSFYLQTGGLLPEDASYNFKPGEKPYTLDFWFRPVRPIKRNRLNNTVQNTDERLLTINADGGAKKLNVLLSHQGTDLQLAQTVNVEYIDNGNTLIGKTNLGVLSLPNSIEGSPYIAFPDNFSGWCKFHDFYYDNPYADGAPQNWTVIQNHITSGAPQTFSGEGSSVWVPTRRLLITVDTASNKICFFKSTLTIPETTILATDYGGETPTNVTVNPAENRAFVTCQDSANILCIDLDNFTVIGSINAPGTHPWDIVIHPDGTRGYFSDFTAFEGRVWRFNPVSLTLETQIPTVARKTAGLAFNNAHTTLYAVGNENSCVVGINTNTDTSSTSLSNVIPTLEAIPLADVLADNGSSTLQYVRYRPTNSTATSGTSYSFSVTPSTSSTGLSATNISFWYRDPFGSQGGYNIFESTSSPNDSSHRLKLSPGELLIRYYYSNWINGVRQTGWSTMNMYSFGTSLQGEWNHILIQIGNPRVGQNGHVYGWPNHTLRNNMSTVGRIVIWINGKFSYGGSHSGVADFFERSQNPDSMGEYLVSSTLSTFSNLQFNSYWDQSTRRYGSLDIANFSITGGQAWRGPFSDPLSSAAPVVGQVYTTPIPPRTDDPGTGMGGSPPVIWSYPTRIARGPLSTINQFFVANTESSKLTIIEPGSQVFRKEWQMTPTTNGKLTGGLGVIQGNGSWRWVFCGYREGSTYGIARRPTDQRQLSSNDFWIDDVYYTRVTNIYCTGNITLVSLDAEFRPVSQSWHHMAISNKPNEPLEIFIDGVLAYRSPSVVFGGTVGVGELLFGPDPREAASTTTSRLAPTLLIDDIRYSTSGDVFIAEDGVIVLPTSEPLPRLTPFIVPGQVFYVNAWEDLNLNVDVVTEQPITNTDFEVEDEWYVELAVNWDGSKITGRLKTWIPHTGEAELPPPIEMRLWIGWDVDGEEVWGSETITLHIRVPFNLMQGPTLGYTHQVMSDQDILPLLPYANKLLINAKGNFYIYDIDLNKTNRVEFSAFGTRVLKRQGQLAAESLNGVSWNQLIHPLRYSWARDSWRVYVSVDTSEFLGETGGETMQLYAAKISDLAAANPPVTAFTPVAELGQIAGWDLANINPSQPWVYFKGRLGEGASVKTYRFNSSTQLTFVEVTDAGIANGAYTLVRPITGGFNHYALSAKSRPAGSTYFTYNYLPSGGYEVLQSPVTGRRDNLLHSKWHFYLHLNEYTHHVTSPANNPNTVGYLYHKDSPTSTEIENKVSLVNVLYSTPFVQVQGGTLPQSSELAGQQVATFQIGKYEVTWGEWMQARKHASSLGYDIGSRGAGSADNHPVRNVSWYDVVKWCNLLSQLEGLTPVYQVGGAVYKTGESEPTVNSSANGYRLPTEAEWEWAARGGVSSQGYTYSGSNDVNAVAWYSDNSSGAAVGLSGSRGTWPVGAKFSNELGIHDMSGNVWEWCWDVAFTGYRRLRGGSWINNAGSCTVAARINNYYPENFGDSTHGFRLVRNTNTSNQYTKLLTGIKTPQVPGGTRRYRPLSIAFVPFPLDEQKYKLLVLADTGAPGTNITILETSFSASTGTFSTPELVPVRTLPIYSPSTGLPVGVHALSPMVHPWDRSVLIFSGEAGPQIIKYFPFGENTYTSLRKLPTNSLLSVSDGTAFPRSVEFTGTAGLLSQATDAPTRYAINISTTGSNNLLEVKQKAQTTAFDYIDELVGDRSFFVEGWFRFGDTNAKSNFIEITQNSGTTPNDRIQLSLTSNGAFTIFVNTANTARYNSVQITPNSTLTAHTMLWKHIRLQRSRNNHYYIYLDGVLQPNPVSSPVAHTFPNPMRIRVGANTRGIGAVRAVFNEVAGVPPQNININFEPFGGPLGINYSRLNTNYNLNTSRSLTLDFVGDRSENWVTPANPSIDGFYSLVALGPFNSVSSVRNTNGLPEMTIVSGAQEGIIVVDGVFARDENIQTEHYFHFNRNSTAIQLIENQQVVNGLVINKVYDKSYLRYQNGDGDVREENSFGLSTLLGTSNCRVEVVPQWKNGSVVLIDGSKTSNTFTILGSLESLQSWEDPTVKILFKTYTGESSTPVTTREVTLNIDIILPFSFTTSTEKRTFVHWTTPQFNVQLTGDVQKIEDWGYIGLPPGLSADFRSDLIPPRVIVAGRVEAVGTYWLEIEVWDLDGDYITWLGEIQVDPGFSLHPFVDKAYLDVGEETWVGAGISFNQDYLASGGPYPLFTVTHNGGNRLLVTSNNSGGYSAKVLEAGIFTIFITGSISGYSTTVSAEIRSPIFLQIVKPSDKVYIQNQQITPFNLEVITSLTGTQAQDIWVGVNNLPVGLTLSGRTISGTPTALTTSNGQEVGISTQYWDQATNTIISDSDTFKITVDNIVFEENLTLTSAGRPVGSWFPDFDRGKNLVSYWQQPVDLPAGLVQNTNTSPLGMISGTAAAAGSGTFIITACTAQGACVSKEIPYNITLTQITLNPSTLNLARNQSVDYVLVASGEIVSNWSIFGFLPTGILFNRATGTFTGTAPNVSESFVVFVRANHEFPEYSSEWTQVNINIGIGPLSLPTSIFLTGIVGEYLEHTVSYNGQTPTTWWIDEYLNGEDIWEISEDGVISGTPGEVGNSRFTIYAANDERTSNLCTVFIDIGPAPTPPNPFPPDIKDLTIIVTQNQFFSKKLFNAGGAVSDYTLLNVLYSENAVYLDWEEIDATTLNVTLSQNGTETSISGILENLGIYQFSYELSNVFGDSEFVCTLRVADGRPIIPMNQVFAFVRNSSLSGADKLVVEGNNPTSIAFTSLPTGINFDSSTFRFTGQAPQLSGESLHLVTASNASGSSPQTTVKFVITDIPIEIPKDQIIQVIANETFSEDILYLGDPPTSVTALGLPPGVEILLSPNLRITGNTASGNTTSIQLKLTNFGNSEVSERIDLQVTTLPPQLTAQQLTGEVGTPFNFKLSFSGGVPTAWGYTQTSKLPPGLRFSLTAGEFTGTPTQAGTYTMEVFAQNSGGTSSIVNITITVTQSTSPPSILPGQIFDLVRNVTISELFLVYSGETPTNWSTSKLPSGLTIDQNTGKISGFLTAMPGVIESFITARSAGGVSTELVIFNIAAFENAPSLLANQIFTLTVNQPIAENVTISFTGNNVTITATGLPLGMSIAPTTGKLQGRPTTVGIFNPQVTITNSGGTATEAIEIIVMSTQIAPQLQQDLLTLSLLKDTLMPSYTFQNSGGEATNWSATGLPVGLNFNNGILTGRPRVLGSNTLTVIASNSLGSSSTSLLIEVVSVLGLPTINSQTISGIANLRLSRQLAATGNILNWALVDSVLPQGLTLNSSSGLLSGTPTNIGTTSAVIKVTNEVGSAQATITFIISSNVKVPVIVPGQIFRGKKGLALSYRISTGIEGNAATGWKIASGQTLHPGVSLDFENGVLSGVPTVTGISSTTLIAFNSAGDSIPVAISLEITENSNIPILPQGQIFRAVVGVAYTKNILFSGTVTEWRVVAGNLPNGLILDSVTGVISGTATEYTSDRTVRIFAGNADGGVEENILVGVNDQIITIPTGQTFNGFVGDTLTAQIQVAGTPISWLLNNPPASLNLVISNTGVITGAPSQEGQYDVVVTAAAAGGTGTSGTIKINIGSKIPKITPNQVINITTVNFISYNIAYSVISNVRPDRWSLMTPLPAGLNLNTATGNIFGTATQPTGAAGLDVAVKIDSSYGSSTETIKLFVTSADTLLKINPEQLFTVSSNIPFEITPTYVGNPTRWYILELPAGITINSTTGKISGTFTTPGTRRICVYCENSKFDASAFINIVVT